MSSQYRNMHEVDEAAVLRDPRPLGTRIFQFLGSPGSIRPLYLGGAIFSVLVPGAGPFVLIFLLILLPFQLLKKPALPFYLPKSSGFRLDPNTRTPDGKKIGKPEGIAYFGTSKDLSGREEQCWFTNTALRAHQLWLMTTGGGKTAGLTSQLVNNLVWGGGFGFIDGKADLDVPVRIIALAHRFGRVDDVLILSYITGGRDIWDVLDHKITNTFSFLNVGSSSSIGELMVSMMDLDDDIWGKRADDFMRSLIRILVYLRETEGLMLTPQLLADYMDLNKLGALVAREDIPETARKAIDIYIRNLPGVNASVYQSITAGTYQGIEEVDNQHGYIRMQLVQLANLLGGEYGHIFNVRSPDILLDDVVKHDRILLTLLPALEKAPASLANTGRVVLSAFKAMMAASLGDRIEGDVDENLKSRPTNSPYPFTLVCDEVGYYFVEGTAVTAAQARSLGFGMIYAAQDLAAMRRINESAEKETDSVLGNTRIKIIGAIEETKDTLEYIQQRGGEAYFAESSAEARHGAVSSGYMENSLSYTRHSRINVRKLVEFENGSCYIMHRDGLVEAKLFYAQEPKIKRVQLNHYVELHEPPDELINRLGEQYEEALMRLETMIHEGADGDGWGVDDEDESLVALRKRMRRAERQGAGFVESALAGLYLDKLERDRVIEEKMRVLGMNSTPVTTRNPWGEDLSPEDLEDAGPIDPSSISADDWEDDEELTRKAFAKQAAPGAQARPAQDEDEGGQTEEGTGGGGYRMRHRLEPEHGQASAQAARTSDHGPDPHKMLGLDEETIRRSKEMYARLFGITDEDPESVRRRMQAGLAGLNRREGDSPEEARRKAERVMERIDMVTEYPRTSLDRDPKKLHETIERAQNMLDL